MSFGRFVPVGCTDSEHAFCHLLQILAERYPDGPPDPASLHATLREIAILISHYGEFNFLLSNGTHLFAHCSTTGPATSTVRPHRRHTR